ncbi:MAG TPA: DUF3553 domain-containing protein [Polyangiaceae bacterium]|nr:DUF3553 domain-containing protein [Polyangiaceae bacterium]
MRFVRNVKQPDWGVGRVLEEEHEGKVKVFFENAGERTVALGVAGLPPVDDGEVEPDNVLRHLKPDASGKYVVPPLTFKQIVENFRTAAKGGFDSPHYLEHERNYKVKAADLAASLLAPARLKADLDGGAHDAIFDAHQKVVGKTNLLLRFERSPLGEVKGEKRAPFADALVGLLAGEGDFDARFDALAGAFTALGIGTWPTCTYALFLTRRQDHLFVRPTYVQRAAGALGYEIQYEPRPNSKTYRRILGFASDVRKKLTAQGMPPRDMIDVQSFLWVGGGGLRSA